MDEIWERAVETALDGQTDVTSVRTLTLDGAVKCVPCRLPHPSLFQKFPHLQHLSIANIGVSSLEQFPRLQNLHKLILSDNRIAGGLEFLVEAGLESLRDLDLSNNRIQEIDDLRPLAELRLVSLDLYRCPVTRVKDYRSRVFGLIKSLKYLDKTDVDENERPESEDEDDENDEEDEDEGEEEDDPGSGEIDGEENGPDQLTNGHAVEQDGVVDVDEDDESDADEESEIVRGSSGNGHRNGWNVEVNGFHGEDDDEEDGDDDSDEIDEDEGGDDEEDVIEVHEIDDSDDEEDGVEDDDEDDEEDKEVDNDDGDLGEPGRSGWVTSTEGEIDGHEQGEDDVDEDDDGETGEEEIGVDEGDFEDDEEAEDEEEEDAGTGYLVQPVAQVAEGIVVGNEEDYPEVEEEEEEEYNEDGDEDEENDDVVHLPSSSSKRKRDGDDDDDGDGDGDGREDDSLVPHHPKSSKHN